MNEALGYDHVARIVKQSIAERRPLIDVVIEDGALDESTARHLLDAVDVARGNRDDSSSA